MLPKPKHKANSTNTGFPVTQQITECHHGIHSTRPANFYMTATCTILAGPSVQKLFGVIFAGQMLPVNVNAL